MTKSENGQQQIAKLQNIIENGELDSRTAADEALKLYKVFPDGATKLKADLLQISENWRSATQRARQVLDEIDGSP